MSAKRKPAADLEVEPIMDQALAEIPPMAVPPTLGPGDDDPMSRDRGTPAMSGGPLGPGDDDPRQVDRGTPAVVRGPLAPGETDPNGEQRNFRMLAQPAPGPGDVFTQRRLTVIPNDEPKKE